METEDMFSLTEQKYVDSSGRNFKRQTFRYSL